MVSAGGPLALDISQRGPALGCFRESLDSHAVAGARLVEADAGPEPGHPDPRPEVDGELLQPSSTRPLICSVPKPLESAASYDVLQPGDIG